MSIILGAIQDEKIPNIKFSLEEFNYEWNLDSTYLRRTTLFRPEVKFRVKNSSSVPIKYLEVLIQFQDGNENKIFSKEEHYLVGSGDLPLEEGMMSEMFFFKSSIGLDLDKALPFINIEGLEELNEKHIQSLKEQTTSIYPVLYYKADYSSDWIKYEG